MSSEKKFYTQEELQEFRSIINKKLTVSNDEYKSLMESLKDSTIASSDGHNLTDVGSETTDKEQTEMFMARQKKFINALERALVRIENGSYGRCKVTGKLISKERLQAVPHTELSIEAKLNQKKN
ncbi:MAG TPA: TraR/DksA family transcriptional regulator [Bacteroidetes bacterium]|nr:TraR/DksA family transcriptional regulator [Bacteroidota bacterium]